MKVINRYLLLLLVFLILIMAAGCEKNELSSLSEDGKVELSEKEKIILRESGLPEEYDQLNDLQKKSISRIGLMLEYAEEKYGISFCFKGYERESVLSGEELILYPEGGDEMLDLFWVREDQNGEFQDGYMNIYVRPYIREYILNNVKQLSGTELVKVFTDVSSTDLDYGSEISVEDLPGHVNADSMIFIDETGIDEKSEEDVKEAIGSFLWENAIYGLNQVIVLKEGLIDLLTDYNYSNYLSGDYYIYRSDCNIQ